MKKQYRISLKLRGIFFLIMNITTLTAWTQVEMQEDKTLSPYFIVQSDDNGTDNFPLKSITGDVIIAGVIADVRVKQVFKNEGANVLEALYVFPGSTRAAVYGMKMTIGNRVIEAMVEERNKARQDYEAAKQSGQSASLLEQQRPNVFQMNVTNILPGDEIIVELDYTELLIPEGGIYEFVYPTVVGPRYSNDATDLASSGKHWLLNPYTSEGKLPSYTFDLKIALHAGLPIKDVVCSSHKTNVQFSDKNKVAIELTDGEKFGGNRDFVLNYRLQGDEVESGLLLYEGEEENFFMMMVQPPEQLKPEYIPPREYVFIVDISGSMNGFPLDVSKTLLNDLIGNLRPVDRFNILLFAGSSKILSAYSLEPNPKNISNALRFLNSQRGGGGTELLPALKRALALKGTEDYSRTFVIATDGYVNVEKETFDLIRKNLGTANFFAFGIGSSVNRYIIEGIAHVGKGLPFVAMERAEAIRMAEKFRKYVSNPVLTNITLNFDNFVVHDVEPVEVPDLFSKRPVLVYGKYRGPAKGFIEVSGRMGNKIYNKELDIRKYGDDRSFSALKFLWARERIRILDDYTNLAQNETHADEIITLGLKYNLLTAYTSFIAIDSGVRNEDGKVISVKQPLPLPHGVSNYAIGSTMQFGGSPGTGMPAKGCMSVSNVTLNEEVMFEVSMDEEVPLLSVVEKAPEFVGGDSAFRTFLLENLTYPSVAIEERIEGTVFVEFTVNYDGTVEDVSIIRSVNESLDNEAIRLIKLTHGNWKPGLRKGKPVDVKMVIPIKFRL